jgi:NAD(P)-dependent dehydrogenase (short-subunit alcohol dehydrogenase family)
MSRNPPTESAALVTGAARRIGRDLALDLAKTGWHVAIHYRKSSAEAETLAHDIAGFGGTAKTFSADLADRDSLARLVAEVERELGPLTTLINKAS